VDWKTSDYTIIQIPFLRWNISKMSVHNEKKPNKIASMVTFKFKYMDISAYQRC
jgi:hypothetical protein